MSSKTLVIVESPGKIKKISEILGNDYIVKASIGHVQDLDRETLSIDVENNFKPLYIICPDKQKVVKELKALSKDCSDTILAADGDREGEAIANSLATVLNLKNPKRIIFNEITKNAILKAIKSPVSINNDMVNAQQARRLLDRLIGYKISPILWKSLGNDCKSAGRVQSVAIKIIVDKENDINKSISEPYFKTIGEFSNLSSVLEKNNKLYNFENSENVINFYNKIDKKTEFKVINVDNKKSVRKPSPPFITSSLQQEASTKLHFSVKKTMDVAQKLYEKGLITYMRSDSPNISNDAMKKIEKYIIEKYGKEYSDPKNYSSKNSNSQDAHECIRPTHLDEPEPDNLDKDQEKLYSLIWKRTIASQMSNAQVNVQTIQIDSKVLPKDSLFISTLENIEFAGYQIVYDNSLEDEEKIVGKLDIKVNDILKLNKIKTSEEYTKPPLRYNEALLVKYLEKNGIGRPSTYASIISKIIEHKYIQIKNIDGVKKESKIIELDKFKIKESIKEIVIGKEQKKLVPTETGKQINDFLQKHFDSIIDIQFTSDFETYLDKIAEGNANWVTVLRNYYDKFNPIVEKLALMSKENKDELLGKHNDLNVYKGTGKYGDYVKIQDGDKWRYAKILDKSLNDIKLKDAIEILEFPKKIGKIGNAVITVNQGKYGLYLNCNKKNYPIKNVNITVEEAKEIINSTDPYALKSFKDKDKTFNIKSGEYGNYIQILNGKEKQNISITEEIDIEEMTLDDVYKIIESQNKFALKSFNIKDKVINIKNGDYGYYLQIVSGKKRQNISIPKKYDIEKISLENILEIIANKNGTK